MTTQKFCCVNGCINFVFAKLDDFDEVKWSAFKVGNKEVKCFCPNHHKEFKEAIYKEYSRIKGN